ncbi:lumican isoform X2 [Lampris incognitus]|uniref:lumican isoform X2 n=1 Tax=Lampris incognitus TaxID=2546036 RepID=UPI0024B53C7F|nr:lumican isoform X2 [Lampris incognitus]
MHQTVAPQLFVQALPMAFLHCVVLALLCWCEPACSTTGEDLDYGGVPLWFNRWLGEPSVLSLQGRVDPAWYRANNPQICPQHCDCPIQWPTALYCDHKALADVPDGLPCTTQYLFLQGNNISALTSSALANTTGLLWLILDRNQLQNDKLDPTALQNLTQLRYLFANNNRLSTVPAGLPAGLKQLRLAHNHINTIDPDIFNNLHNLTLLLLQGNRLQTLAPRALTDLVSLTLLDLSGNLFSSVPRNLPPSVEQLYLSNNSLSALDDNSFLGFHGLKFLRLSRCGLQSPTLHPLVFNVSSLVELDLSYNKLTVIPPVPTTLQYLYLEANEIKEFNTTSFCREVGPLSYSRMRILRLDGNKMSRHQLPPDWAFCLRVLHNIYI